MQDVSSSEAAHRPPGAHPASHGPLWLWGLAALVVGLSAAIIAAAWVAGARSRAPLAPMVEAPPLADPAEQPVSDAAIRAAVAAREAAAAQGDAIAQYEMALAYINGTGVNIDIDRGIDFMRRSAAQDYIPAIMALPEVLSGSVALGIADPAEVFDALDRVIADPPDDTVLGAAQEYYGRYLLYVLPAADRDPAGAVDRFVLGLAAGNLLAAKLIGDAYRSGEGRPVDPVLAYAYYKVAQPIMPDELGPPIYEMELRLTPAELDRAATLTLPALLAQEPDLSH